jgi:hypothetical protein
VENLQGIVIIRFPLVSDKQREESKGV